jgi:hypothetical protein
LLLNAGAMPKPDLNVELSVEQTIPFLKDVRSAQVIPVAMPQRTVQGTGAPGIPKSQAPQEMVIVNKPRPTSPVVAQPRTMTSPVVQPKILSQSAKWKQFHEIGLAPKPAHQQGAASKAASKLVVSSYRLLGISILSLIVFVLIGYVGTTAFYFMSHSWVVPTIISPSDDKVIQAKNELAAAQNLKSQFEANMHDSERAVAVEQEFQIAFAKAVADDLGGRKTQLDRLRGLANAAAATRVKVRNTTSAYAQSFTAQQKNDYDGGLIDRSKMMAGTYQIAQMSSSNIDLAQKQVEIEGQADELARDTRSLDALLEQRGSAALSYDVLKIKRDYDTSKLALAKAVETRDQLKDSIARQDDIIASLKSSAYLRALDDKAITALVPYTNIDNAKPGTSLYSCKVAMVWCHQVGTIQAVLPGEVPIRHPHDDSLIRGQMIEMQLDDAAAAQDLVLYVNGAPLFF